MFSQTLNDFHARVRHNNLTGDVQVHTAFRWGNGAMYSHFPAPAATAEVCLQKSGDHNSPDNGPQRDKRAF